MEEVIKDLQEQIKKLEVKGSKSPVVYLKSERKFPKFGGRPVKDGDPDVYEWISDMREHIQSAQSKDDFVDFIMDHLTGSAKSEVKLRPHTERKTGKQILDILETVFEIKETTTQLLQKFYQRDQREDETLEKYSLVLTEMTQKINKKDKKEQVNDVKLTERFIDGIRDQNTRQELRKVVLDSGNVPFFEFRLKMLRWIEDNPKMGLSIKKITTQNTELSEMMTLVKKQQEMLDRQQQQIDRLTRMSDGKFNRQLHVQPEERGRSRQRFGPRFNRGSNGRRGSSIVARGRQCYNCGGMGHISSNCPSEKELNSASRPTSVNPNWKPSQ
ncbi:uncharacterized protein LOC111132484 [Crassostrea virginica]|uniref:Uncharacterized protein LOC111132484 n=1 Tax=Crassostrea virginica TaxID=6565 RepID=A0A8B8E5X4_CRAVI|nr:uncharacterized protein LOC111132484 [Crassostrea virginica]